MIIHKGCSEGERVGLMEVYPVLVKIRAHGWCIRESARSRKTRCFHGEVST